MTWYLLLALLFIFSITAFAIQNAQMITLKFLGWEMASFPLVMVIFFSAILGSLITLLFNLSRQLRMNIQKRELEDRLRQMEKKIQETEIQRKEESSTPNQMES